MGKAFAHTRPMVPSAANLLCIFISPRLTTQDSRAMPQPLSTTPQPHRSESQRLIHPPPLPPDLGETQIGNKSGWGRPAEGTPVKTGKNRNQKTRQTAKIPTTPNPFIQAHNPRTSPPLTTYHRCCLVEPDQKRDGKAKPQNCFRIPGSVHLSLRLVHVLFFFN